METGKEDPDYGVIFGLAFYTNERFCFKLKPVLLISKKFEYGLCRKLNDNSQGYIECRINRTSYRIVSKDGGLFESCLCDLQLPLDSFVRLLEIEVGVEVNTEACTIRFLVNGEQKHDGDIAIPLTREELKSDTWFSVKLFAPGDCVCIID